MAEVSLAEWVFYRFSASVVDRSEDGGAAWEALDEDSRLHWQHEADAVRRAVERDGGRPSQPAVLALGGVRPAHPGPGYGWTGAVKAPDRDWDDS